ncbi:glycosyltransferase [Allokutzneria sp. A3M-2-11 16]|uniref:glycosyltransferase n=1 Tax=Allokutzneria sp. A3M-2-11 16 TaxID=2962043 RepID=UPI0020B69F2E|nr:glycosyltransferase [Allokutzneria sp. A3M-2-11 16]MCP3801481.1 glycosyltransferase [Allokutzneria sp. A3M-2-11 16]
MHVLLATAGSRGDVAPYTGLGVRLAAEGHKVTIATHEPFEEFVRACGLGFRALPGDPRQAMESEQGQRWSQAKSSAVGMFRQLKVMKSEIRSGALALADVVEEEGPDVLLAAPLVSSVSFVTGKGLRIPSAGVFLAPGYPTREFAPVLSKSASFGPAGNLLAGHAITRMVAMAFGSAAAVVRERYGLPKVSLGQALRQQNAEKWPVFNGYSRHVIPRPADWREGIEVCGYWWPHVAPGYEPPAELVEFLDAGPPPVFIGFGSMVPGDGERLGRLAAAALKQAGVRGVIQAGWAELNTVEDENLISIGDVPHEWLFPRMAAVVHHAGAGTSAAALRAGAPAVPVPVLADQPFWSGRLARLGVATAPVPMQSLTADRLGAAIHAAVTEPGYRERAEGLAKLINAEDGAAPVVEFVNGL